MKKLLCKLLIITTPFIIMMIIFIGFDPMKIIYNYKSPVEKGVLMNDRLFMIKYLNKSKINYDSFIFGSSRSKAFKTSKWQKYIQNGKAYHMGVNDESIYGIYGKILFLYQNNYSINNALLVIDNRILSLDRNSQFHIFREPPEITGEKKIQFYKIFFTAFLTPKFLLQLIQYKISSKVKDGSLYLWDPGFAFDRYSGDIFYTKMDSLINKDSIKYYSDRAEIFYSRNYIVNYIPNKNINNIVEVFLKKIKYIFEENSTNYRVIISPNYSQKEINKEDLNVLKTIFGEGNVFNFSGVTNITNNIGNYYEEKHFKPFIADSLMKIIYNK